METKTKTIEERLNDILNEKDREIEKLEEEIQRLKVDLRGAESGWTIHEKLDDNQTLPVPRLEILIVPDGYENNPWYEKIYKYRLVYKHFTGDIIAIPFGETKSSGGDGKPVYSSGENAGKPRMPYRDGAHICHDMKVFNLPGFVICEDVVADISHLAGKPEERWL